jgi:hypothetical protein
MVHESHDRSESCRVYIYIIYGGTVTVLIQSCDALYHTKWVIFVSVVFASTVYQPVARAAGCSRCFKCKTNVSCLVLEFSIHEQSEGALITLEHLAAVLIALTSLSGCCLYGSKIYFAWHRQKSCSRERLGIYTDADKKSDCLRKGCWLENRLHEPCLPCLCRRSIDWIWA